MTPTPWHAHPRILGALLLLMPTGAVATSFFVQHRLHIDPCTLCIFQRLAYLACAILAGLAFALHRRPSGRVFCGATLVVALAGLGVAGYQTWLQAFPPAHAGCSASFAMLMDDTLLERPWHFLMDAPGDCTEITFRILGLSMAQASVLLFTAIAAVAARALFHARNPASAPAAA